MVTIQTSYPSYHQPKLFLHPRGDNIPVFAQELVGVVIDPTVSFNLRQCIKTVS